MKSYVRFIECEAPTENHENLTEKYVISPDPKRDGLYKVTLFYSTDNYKKGYSFLYGKCNQATIQEWIAESEELN